MTGLLQQPGVVTLVGPAGVGKTRLAIDVAHAAAPAGGAWMVRLDALRAGASVGELLEAVATTLHVAPEAGALQDRLRGAPTLIVLDNCEHVVTAAADLVDWLRDASPQVRAMATSQLPLGVDDEEVVDVSPLPHAAAVDLFEQLVARQRRRPTSTPGREASTGEASTAEVDRDLVEKICGALDGLPLALELAAARVRSLPLDEVARRLSDRFALLRDPSRSPDRRHALEAALSWSYDLLFPDDQRALQALSCFASGGTLPAVEAVMAALDVPPTAVPDTLARLVERSLTVLDTGVAAPRYRLLDSVRAHAQQRLGEAGGLDAARHAHASWYAERASQCAEEIRGPAQPSWLDFVRAERAEVDASLAWAASHDEPTGTAIAVGLGWAWAVLGDGSAAATRLRSAVGPRAELGARARAALYAAWLEASAGDLALAHDDLEVAAAAVAELSTAQRVAGAEASRRLADLAWTRAFVAVQDGRPAEVLADASEALAVYRELDLAWECGAALLLLAYGSLMVGEATAAGAHASAAVELIEECGDLWGLVHARGILAGVSAAGGRFGEAAQLFESAADAAAAMGFAGQAALHLASRARILVAVGDLGASDAVDRALEAAAGVGDGRLTCGLRVHAAQLARSAGEEGRARLLLQANEDWFADHGGGDRAGVTRALLLAMNDDEDALTELVVADPDASARQVALDALARLAARRGDAGRAAELMGEADAVVVPAPDFVLRVDRPAG